MTPRMYSVALTGLALIALRAGAADPLVLESAGGRYAIDSATGGIAGGQIAGTPFLVESRDEYGLLPPGEGELLRSDESADRVVERVEEGAGGAITLLCENEALGVRLRKTYRIDEDSGWLHKRIVVTALPGTAGRFRFESGVQVPGEWWRGAVIWQPVYHTARAPFFRTRDIREEIDLAPTNGARAMAALHQPRRDACVVHYYWGDEQFTYFHVTGEVPGYSKRAWPRRWAIGAQRRFLGGPHDRRITMEWVYGVHPGSARDFLLYYRNTDDYQRLWIDPLLTAPAWTQDVYIDEHWDTSYLRHGYDDLLRDVMAKKIHFGFMSVVQWGAFPYELYIAKPEDNEPGSGEDPVATAERMQQVKSWSPRIKTGLYSHFGGVSAKRDSRLHRLAEEKGWLSHRRDGSPWAGRTDYDMKDDKAAFRLTRAADGYREFLIRRCAEHFQHLNIDFMNLDTSPTVGGYECDWKEMRVTRPRVVQDLYNEFLRIAQEHGGTTQMNMPIPTASTAGFTEWPWFSQYSRDWRLFSGRVALQTAMSVAGRRLYFAGQIMPQGLPTDPMIRLHLNSMRMFAMGLGMLDVKSVERKRDLYQFGAPWIQAGYELRNRDMVDAGITPNWMEAVDDTEVEAYAWRMVDPYGLVTVLNHDTDATTQAVAFATKPLGLRPGKPVFVWRLEMPDPNCVEYDGVTMDTPIRRLAELRLLAAGEPLPKRFSTELALQPENPVELVLTHSPAVIESVDGKRCQYRLPAAYGVTAGGSVTEHQVNAVIENPKAAAVVLVFSPKGRKASVTQRRWSESHAAGVAAGFDEIAHEFLDIDGRVFVQAEVPPGTTELLIGP